MAPKEEPRVCASFPVRSNGPQGPSPETSSQVFHEGPGAVCFTSYLGLAFSCFFTVVLRTEATALQKPGSPASSLCTPGIGRQPRSQRASCAHL